MVYNAKNGPEETTRIVQGIEKCLHEEGLAAKHCSVGMPSDKATTDSSLTCWRPRKPAHLSRIDKTVTINRSYYFPFLQQQHYPPAQREQPICGPHGVDQVGGTGTMDFDDLPRAR